MNNNLANLEIKAFEIMYLRETRILKYKLLSAVFTRNILKEKNKAIAVALADHSKQYAEAIIPDNFWIKQI